MISNHTLADRDNAALTSAPLLRIPCPLIISQNLRDLAFSSSNITIYSTFSKSISPQSRHPNIHRRSSSGTQPATPTVAKMTRTVFTTITAIPAGVSRETVMETLHDHLEMIDLNPAHDSREPIKPPPEASPEEYHCTWYQITDKISYLPGMKGDVRFKACFHDLPMGLQTHVYAPMGLDIKEKWTLGGNLPHEPVQPVEIGVGAPISGLYLREDVEMKCNFLMTKFVKKQLKDALATLVARLAVKSQLVEAVHQNRRLTYDPSNPASQFTPPLSPPMSPRQTYSPPMSPPPTGGMGMQMDYPPKWAEAHAQQQQGGPNRDSYVQQQPQGVPNRDSYAQQQQQQHQGGSQRNSYNPAHYSPAPQYSPQFPTQQHYQQQLMQQQQQQQGQQDPNKPSLPMVNEMDATQQYQQYGGGHHGHYGPAELPS